MDVCFKPEQGRNVMRVICSPGTQLKWEKIQQYENRMVWWTSANCISSSMHFDNYSFLTTSLYFQQCVRQFTAGEKVKFTESPSVVSYHSSRNKSSSQEVKFPNTFWNLQMRTEHQMGNILGPGHIGIRFASSRCPEQGAGGAGMWPEVLSMEICKFRVPGLQRREERFWSHSTGVKGLVPCSAHAQQCQHFHKTQLRSRTPLLEWLSKQQETSKALIKQVTTTPKSHQWGEGMHYCCHCRRTQKEGAVAF